MADSGKSRFKLKLLRFEEFNAVLIFTKQGGNNLVILDFQKLLYTVTFEIGHLLPSHNCKTIFEK